MAELEFSSNAELEALIGRACLVFARVEQEAGHVVASAHGNWGVAMSTDYLYFSSNSGLLLDWLKAVGVAYPEVKEDLNNLGANLRRLKARRDHWAHSAATIDLFLLMKEQDQSSIAGSGIDSRKLLSGKKMGHFDAPTEANVVEFTARASKVGDAASTLAIGLAKLADPAVRAVKAPEGASRRSRR